MRFSTNSKTQETPEGTQVFVGTVVADLKGERVFAMRPAVAVSAITDGTEAVALVMGSRSIARGLGARAIADGKDTTATAYGVGAIAIALTGGTARAFEGASVYKPHTLYTNADSDRHPAICDSNGVVVLAECKVCGKAESELTEWNCV